jgi:integrase
MRATAIKVRPYRHSATSKWQVTWCTGKRPSRQNILAWEKTHPDASGDDRKRFLAGTWERHRRFFQSVEDAQTFADAQRVKLVNEGQRGLALDDGLRIMAARCAKRLEPYGFTLDQAVEHFIEHIKATRRSIAVAALVDEYKAAKRRGGKSARYLKDLDFRLAGFERFFGAQRDSEGVATDQGRIVETLRVAEIDDWLTALGLSPQSVNNYRAVAHALFEYAVKRDYAKSNPVSKVEKVKLVDKPAAIFRPEELARLLDHATDEVLPVLAIGAFAGLRMAEIFRLDWAEVDQTRGFIEVTAEKSKTSRRRLVKLTDNLKAWLRPFAAKKGPVWPLGETMWRVKLEPVRKAAQLAVWPENGLRHSFGSYHLAKWNDAAALALQMGHTTTKEIFAHYRELVRPDEAERYWSICPQMVVANIVSIEEAAI